jgi:hypothetical protein
MREPVGSRRRFKTSDEWWHNLALVDEVTGRKEAIQAQATILAEREEAIDRLIATPAASNVGRAAKARVLVRHIVEDGWRQALAGGGDLPGTRGRDPCRSMWPQREGID